MDNHFDLTNDQIEMLRFFCLILIPDFKGEYYNMPYLNFVFKESDIQKITYYLRSMEVNEGQVTLNIRVHLPQREIASIVIDKVLAILNKTKKEYDDNPQDDSIYIWVSDYQEFFELLENIRVVFEDKSPYNNFNVTALLRTIWLRMGVTDINNVLIFLKRQLQFIKNDYLFNTYETNFREYNSLIVSYENRGNRDWFETNRHMRFFLKKLDEDSPSPFGYSYLYYSLPVIHYALIKEDDKPTCYIYGIQNLDNSKDEKVKELIQKERRRLRNKEVSPDFILALNLFIELLKSKGITHIKVPLLQVFNYTYHEHLGMYYKRELTESYSPEKIVELEELSKSKSISDEVQDYKENKDLCDKYYGKEDIISKNKTERLLETFKLVKEYYGNLEFMSEPFIEGDNLVCNIVNEKNINRKDMHK